MKTPVGMLLKILISGLLLVLAVALGTEVAALHRSEAAAGTLVAPVVVRKAPGALPAPKSVRALPRPGTARAGRAAPVAK